MTERALSLLLWLFVGDELKGYGGYTSGLAMKVIPIKKIDVEVFFVVRQAPDLPGQWVGHCLDFDVISQGNSPEQALLMTVEAASIVVFDDLRRGADPFERKAPSDAWEEFVQIRTTGHRVESIQGLKGVSAFVCSARLTTGSHPHKSSAEPKPSELPAWVIDKGRRGGHTPARR